MKNKIQELPKVLGIYLRVSTPKQVVKGVSIDNQKQRGIDRATKEGWTYKVYDDSGISGAIPIEKRKGLKQLMKDLEDTKLGGVYFNNFDRASRDYVEGPYLLSRFKDLGVRFFDEYRELNLKDAGEFFSLNINSAVASLQRIDISNKVKSALEGAMRQGRNAGGGQLVAFGYDRVDKRLVRNEKEAKVVIDIYSRYIKGEGSWSIANTLNELKVLTKRNGAVNGSMKVRNKKGGVIVKGENGEMRVEYKKIDKKKSDFVWRDSVILRILQNPIYKGLKRFNDIEIDGHVGVPCPIIIEPKVWDAVQRMFKEKMRFKKNPTNKINPNETTSNKYLLKSMITCAHCGEHFYGKKRKDLHDNAYVCLSQRFKGKFCGNRGIDIDYLDNLVWEQLLKIEDNVTGFFDKLKKDKGVEKNERDIKDLEKRIEELETEQITTTRNFNRGTIRENVYKKLDKDLQEQIDDLKSATAKFKRNIGLYLEKELVLKNIKSYMSLIKTKRNFTFEDKQTYIRAFINNITISQGFSDGRIHLPNEKQVTIEFKLDTLTDYKLSKNIQIEYKKNGYSLRRTGNINEEFTITKHYLTKNVALPVTIEKTI